MSSYDIIKVPVNDDYNSYNFKIVKVEQNSKTSEKNIKETKPKKTDNKTYKKTKLKNNNKLLSSNLTLIKLFRKLDNYDDDDDEYYYDSYSSDSSIEDEYENIYDLYDF